MKKLIFASKDNPWSNYLFDRLACNDHRWTYVKSNDELYSLDLDTLSHIFFFHWSDIVSSKVYENCECVVVHTANLPEGKGGSPLQNQIVDGVVQTNVNLLKMIHEIDGGDVYCSSKITLQGSLHDIWMSIADVTYGLITGCIESCIIPQKQLPTTTRPYKRRTDNALPLNNVNIYDVYRFIQMLDAPGYPDANLNLEKYSLHFSRAKMIDGQEILCDVKIKRRNIE